MNLWFLFYGIIFVSFGAGVFLTQLIGEKIQSGLIYLGIGFILLIIGVLNKRHNSY